MKATVHIGLNKSRITSIQGSLACHRAALLDHGVLYDRFDGRDWTHPTSQEHFVEALYAPLGTALPFPFLADHHRTRDAADLTRFAEAFEKDRTGRVQNSTAERTLISSEFLSAGAGTKPQVRALDGWLSRLLTHVRYVLYLRDPARWILSRYAQVLKSGDRYVSFADYLTRKAACGFRLLIEAWTAAIRPDRPTLRLYSEGWRSASGLIAGFRAAAGLPDPGDDNIRQNVKFSTPGETRAFCSANDTTVPPYLTEAQRDQIRAANGPALHWIRTTFFPDAAQLFPHPGGAERTPA